MPKQFIDPNSGAAPQPGGHASGGQMLTSSQWAERQEAEGVRWHMGNPTQDEGSLTTPEEQAKALSGAGLREAQQSTPKPEDTIQPEEVREVEQGEQDAKKSLDEMTKDELDEVARERDLEGRSSMNKDELLKALKASS